MRRAIYQALLKAPYKVGAAGLGILGFIGSVWPDRVKNVLDSGAFPIQTVCVVLLGVTMIYFAVLWLLKPSEEPSPAPAPGPQTTVGTGSHNIGQARDVHIYPPATPAERQERKSPYGGWDDRNLDALERIARGVSNPRGLATYRAIQAVPDMSLAALVDRAKQRFGRNPAESDQDLDHFIIDGVVNRGLHTWGRVQAGKPVMPIRGDAWERGDFSHLQGVLRFKPNIHEREVIEWSDIQFNFGEVKRWFKPDLGPNGWMAGDI